MRLLAACSIYFVYVLSICPPLAVASTSDISINNLTVEVVDREISIDCEVNFGVDEKVKSALSNGVEVFFVVELELQMERDIWLDSRVATLIREFRIKYHALSKQYVIVSIENGNERSFPDLYSAFYYMGRLKSLPLADLDSLQLNHQYYVQARARLVSEKLPLPLRVKSYFSSDWRPSSGWTVWPM